MITLKLMDLSLLKKNVKKRDSCERFKHGGWLYIFYDKKSECDDIVSECLIRKDAWKDIICPENCDYYTKYLPKIEQKKLYQEKDE